MLRAVAGHSEVVCPHAPGHRALTNLPRQIDNDAIPQLLRVRPVMEGPRVQAPRAVIRTAPLFPVAVGLIAGVVLDRFGQLPWPVYWTVFLAAGAAVIPRTLRGRIGPLLVLLAAAALGGGLHLTTARVVPASSIERYAPATRRLARIRGMVSSRPRVLSASDHPFKWWTYRTDRTAFLLDVESLEGVEGDIAVTGRIRVTVHEAVLDVRENEQVEVFGWLYQLRPPRNPGSFDWASFYRRQGVVAGMSCNLHENLRRLGVKPASRWGGAINRLRARVRGMLIDDLATATEEETSLLEAMVLGHRSRLDRRLNEVFIQAGCAHFLAVSGTHVVVLLSFVWGAGRLLMLSRRRCAWFMMAAALMYLVIAEPRPPILRATVMALLFCISLLLGRSRARLNWISAAAVILVLLKPTTVFDVGFQLSFAAVLGVGFLTPALVRFGVASRRTIRRLLGGHSFEDLDGEQPTSLTRTPSRSSSPGGLVRRSIARGLRGVLLLLAVSLAAWLAGMPIVATCFQRIHPWGPVSSVIVFPAMSLVMGLGFAKLLIGALSPTVGSLIAGLLAKVDSLLIAVVERLGSLPGAAVFMTPPPWWWVLAYYLFLAGFAWRFRAMPVTPPGEPAAADKEPRRQPWGKTVPFVGAVALFLLGSAAWCWPKTPPERLVVTVLAVGAGSATVIELLDGATVLYDAGSLSPYDVGRSTVVPFLRYRGITRLDRVYLSHPNLDHFSGLPAVVSEVATGPMVINEYFKSRSPPRTPSRHLLDLLAGRGHEVRTLDPSTTSWQLGGVRFERLWPTGEPDDSLSPNDTSTVLRLSYVGHSILLTGDIEERAQRGILEGGDPHADVLVLPHHGSVRPSSAAFISAVRPSQVIRSSNQRMDETTSALPELVGAIPLHNTADAGAIEIVVDRSGVRVSALSPGDR